MPSILAYLVFADPEPDGPVDSGTELVPTGDDDDAPPPGEDACIELAAVLYKFSAYIPHADRRDHLTWSFLAQRRTSQQGCWLQEHHCCCCHLQESCWAIP